MNRLGLRVRIAGLRVHHACPTDGFVSTMHDFVSTLRVRTAGFGLGLGLVRGTPEWNIPRPLTLTLTLIG